MMKKIFLFLFSNLWLKLLALLLAVAVYQGLKNDTRHILETNDTVHFEF